MKIFFGGIIQGSNLGQDIASQNYREIIKTSILKMHADIKIIDPYENHNNSIDYDDNKASETFFGHIELLKDCSLMIAYLPTASLGTAIEMWQAYENDIPILTISPMTTNWVIRLLSSLNFETTELFEQYIESGGLNAPVKNRRKIESAKGRA